MFFFHSERNISIFVNDSPSLVLVRLLLIFSLSVASTRIIMQIPPLFLALRKNQSFTLSPWFLSRDCGCYNVSMLLLIFCTVSALLSSVNEFYHAKFHTQIDLNENSCGEKEPIEWKSIAEKKTG